MSGMFQGGPSTADLERGVERGINRAIANIDFLLRNSREILELLVPIKSTLDQLSNRSLANIQRQSGYKHVTRVADVPKTRNLWNWIRTIHIDPDRPSMQATWTVQALHPIARACLEASSAVGRAMTILSLLHGKECNVQLTARTRLTFYSALENEIRTSLQDNVPSELKIAEEALDDLLRQYDAFENFLPEDILQGFRHGDGRIRRQMIRVEWDSTFAFCRDNIEYNVFGGKVAGLLALIQLPMTQDLTHMLHSIKSWRQNAEQTLAKRQ